MKGREADTGDGIPVLVMRESQTRSLLSHACAGKSASKEGYSGYLIEKRVEDIDNVQKDVHLKTDQEPAMLAFQASSASQKGQYHTSELAGRRSSSPWKGREGRPGVSKCSQEDEACN